MVARTFRGKIGRQRNTKRTSPLEASYISSIQKQMSQIEENLSAFIDQLEGVTPEVLEESLRPTFDKALNYTPVDTGDLKASGYLVVKKDSKDRTRAEMGFGRGGHPFYTAIVHERTDLQHKSPTRAKFLQTALEEDSSTIPARVAAMFKGLIDG